MDGDGEIHPHLFLTANKEDTLRLMLVTLLALCFVGSATSAITASNYQDRRDHFIKVDDHAKDVFRFFRNHPKLARSTIGKHVIHTQKRLEHRAIRKLDEIHDFVYTGKFLPWKWREIVMCETHMNWAHNSGTYQGAFGFHHDSWDRFNTFGYPSEAYLATPEQQYRVALAIYARYGYSGWGCA